jgi:hypothetical protein
MLVFPPQAIDQLAKRIQRAYLHHFSAGVRDWSGSGVWEVAAAYLLELHRDTPGLPLDPELFVASQSTSIRCDDPWTLLTLPESRRRYCDRVRQIIRNLRRELRRELRGAERRLDVGITLEMVLEMPSRFFSPLGKYILAHRSDRPDLADAWWPEAREQHRSCPLYVNACDGLIGPGLYPVLDLMPGRDLVERSSFVQLPFSIN